MNRQQLTTCIPSQNRRLSGFQGVLRGWTPGLLLVLTALALAPNAEARELETEAERDVPTPQPSPMVLATTPVKKTRCQGVCHTESVQLSSWTLEGEDETELTSLSQLLESDLPEEELSPTPAVALETEKAVAPRPVVVRHEGVGTVTPQEMYGLDEEVIDRVAETFRAILATSAVPQEKRVKAVERPMAVVKVESGFRLDPAKTYTVTADGSLAVVASGEGQVAPDLVSRPSRVEGRGWVVMAPDALPAVAATSPLQGKREASAPRNEMAAVALEGLGNWASLGRAPGATMSVARDELAMTRTADERSSVSLAKQALTAQSSSSDGPIFKVDDSLVRDGLQALGQPGERPTASLGLLAETRAAASVVTVKQGMIRGRIVAPGKLVPENLNVRLAGLEIPAINPDKDGFFEFSGLPLNAKAELLVWDSDMRFTRRLIPVSVGDGGREYVVNLERADVVDSLAKAFGDEQNSLLAGFCAKIDAASPLALVGAQVRVRAGAQPATVRYFTERGLPGRDARELSASGRLCVFNVPSELVDVSVVLANGMRRSFSIHLKPTVFEPEVRLDMMDAVYRSVSTWELLDFDEMMSASSRESMHAFATPGSRSWYDGHVSAAWGRVSNTFVQSERAYSSVAIEQEKSTDRLYFPAGQEFVEVAWGTEADRTEGFSLVARESLKEGGGENVRDGQRRVLVAKDEMPLRMMSEASVAEFERSSGEQIGSSAVFVTVDLAAVGLQYGDARLSVRDTWNSNERVGTVHFVPPPQGSSNPRYLRAFVSGLPAGQHTLLVTDKSGAIKWVDVVRPRQGQVQVISVEGH